MDIYKHRIIQAKPHDSWGTLVFEVKDLHEIQLWSTPMEAPNAAGVG